jgi:hypothetical protein
MMDEEATSKKKRKSLEGGGDFNGMRMLGQDSRLFQRGY